ncbi:hypothetical protein ACWCXX_12505 [Streptomyces sp. NPDC001732]
MARTAVASRSFLGPPLSAAHARWIGGKSVVSCLLPEQFDGPATGVTVTASSHNSFPEDVRRRVTENYWAGYGFAATGPHGHRPCRGRSVPSVPAPYSAAMSWDLGHRL